MICTNCNKELNEPVKFCPHCGMPVANDEITSAVTNDDIFIKTFVTGNKPTTAQTEKIYHYYKENFEHFSYSSEYTQWKWSGFFLGSTNLFYRKAYLAGTFFLAIELFISLLYLFTEMTESTYYIVLLIYMFLSGLFSNYFIYIKYKKVRREAIETFASDVEKQLQSISGDGGTSLVLCLTIVIAHWILIFYFMGMVAIGLSLPWWAYLF